MAFFDTIAGDLAAVGSSIAAGFSDILGGGAAPSADSWKIDGQDWYRLFPYQFVICKKNGDGVKEDFAYYSLPIPPQSLNVQAIPAAQATPTFGGVVEEVNKNVFWNIAMAGTTGIATTRKNVPKPGQAAGGSEGIGRPNAATDFRDKIATTGLLAGLASQLNQGINQVAGFADGALAAGQAFASGDIIGGIGGAVGAAVNAALPPLPYSGSAVDGKNNGFTEIHHLQRFFNLYSIKKDSDPEAYSLEFRYLKAQKIWRITTPLVVVSQNAQNPMLYKYQISMKAWGFRGLTETELEGRKEFDRFGPDGDLKSVNTVSFAGLNNLIGGITGVV